MCEDPIKVFYWEICCTNSSLGRFIKDGKFTVTDTVSGLILQNGLFWLVGWLVYCNAYCGILMARFIMVIMHLWASKVFLKGLDIFSSILSAKGLVKCSNVCCSYLVEKLIMLSSFVTSAWMTSQWDCLSRAEMHFNWRYIRKQILLLMDGLLL